MSARSGEFGVRPARSCPERRGRGRVVAGAHAGATTRAVR